VKQRTCENCRRPESDAGEVVPIRRRVAGKATVYEATVRLWCETCRSRINGTYRRADK
jgi:hypothetical protein